jgi:hypothetical protein
MLLDNIKDLIKEMEEVLVKDPRFKEDINFKNMVKTIYTSNSSKLKTINGMPSYDVTPIILANLSYLGKPSNGDTKLPEVIKAKEEVAKGKEEVKKVKEEIITVKEEITMVKAGCDSVINKLKLIIAELIQQVKLAHGASDSISTASKETLAEIERLFKLKKYDEAYALAKRS